MQSLEKTIELGSLVIKSDRMDETLRFYQAIGLSFTQEKHGTGPVHYSARIGTILFEIYPLEKRDDPSQSQAERFLSLAETGTTRIGLVVANVDQAYVSIGKLNARVLREPKDTIWGRSAVVYDPDGRPVELMEKREASA